MTDAPLTKLQQKVAEAKAAREAAERNTAPAPTPTPAPELAPYAHLAPESDYEPDPFDEVLGNLSIIVAYEKWCGKSRPAPRPGQTESIMVSCPTPAHRDANPSAWLNTQSNTWFCGGCQLGGDTYDIASMYFDIPDYKSGINFGKLRRAMAESLGYGVAKVGKKDVPYLKVVPDPEPPSEAASEAPSGPVPTPVPTPVVEIAATPDVPAGNVKPLGVPSLPPQVGGGQTNETIDAELAEVIELSAGEQVIFPTLDWKKIVTPGTFLDEYMAATKIDDIAEEYHFWNALVALGLSIGRDVYLRDSPNVYGNLFVCLLGLTGDGKSRSMRHLRTVLADALPFDAGVDYPRGVNLVPTPSSAEALISMFTHPIMDPTTQKLIVDYAPVRGLVEFGELAELTGKASRMGSVLKPTLIDFYDMKHTVATHSVTNGIKRAREPYLSVSSSTQPESLKTILHNTDKTSGFLNRWVFASGKPKVRSFFQEDIVELSSATDALKKVHGWAGFGNKEVCVEEMAIELMEEFYHDHLADLVAQEGSGMLSRLPLLYKKLLLLLAANEHSLVVTAEMATKVISMHQYSVEAYGIPTKNIGADDLTNVYNELSAAIRRMTKGDHGPTFNQLQRLLAPRGFPIALVDRAFKILENTNEIEVYAMTNNGRGRPVQRYRWTAS